ncbi:MAG: flippase activity-associated protein Agl23 [Haloarculaceae archaeon]
MPSVASALRRVLTVPRVVALTALVGTLARLLELGHRVFYYDEAWFGYWVLRFLENGAWEYRAILHGPFFARVNSVVFPVLGADDFTARLVVALVGGLLPLAALLFREHLRGEETVALAVVLAFTPTLLYYSRFMRKDLPLAAFMFVTMGLAVRAADTGNRRYLYAGAVTLGVAFATKESVLLWLVTWLGAGLLVLDRVLVTRQYDGDGPVAYLRALGARAGAGARAWQYHLLGAAGTFLAVVVYFYAPRAGDTGGIGFWKALGGRFDMLPDVVAAATLGSADKAVAYWVEGGLQGHPYLPYLTDTLRTLGAGALGVCLLAVVGFCYDRYGREPRALVGFNAYAGVAATVGYPLANFLPVPWSTVHAVVPLAVPAAVGAGAVYRWGRGDLSLGLAVPDRVTAVRPDGGLADERVPSRERAVRGLRVAVAGLLLAGLAANAVATGVETSYLDSDRNARLEGGNELVYYAQAPNELREPVTAIQRATATGGGDVDVLYVGEALAMDEAGDDLPPPPGEWFRRLPLPWYTEAAGANVASVADPAAVEDPPPVVITTEAEYQTVERQLGDGYTRQLHSFDGVGDRTVVVFTRQQG